MNWYSDPNHEHTGPCPHMSDTWYYVDCCHKLIPYGCGGHATYLYDHWKYFHKKDEACIMGNRICAESYQAELIFRKLKRTSVFPIISQYWDCSGFIKSFPMEDKDLPWRLVSWRRKLEHKFESYHRIISDSNRKSNLISRNSTKRHIYLKRPPLTVY